MSKTHSSVTLRSRAMPLTPAQLRVAAPLVYGLTTHEIARQLYLSAGGVASHLSRMRKRMGCPGASRAVLVHALLTARQAPPPVAFRPEPDFTHRERTVIQALAEHTGNEAIGNAIGVPAFDVRAETGAVIAKARARSASQLVGMAHAWGVLGDTAMSGTATATSGPHVASASSMAGPL